MYGLGQTKRDLFRTIFSVTCTKELHKRFNPFIAHSTRFCVQNTITKSELYYDVYNFQLDKIVHILKLFLKCPYRIYSYIEILTCCTFIFPSEHARLYCDLM